MENGLATSTSPIIELSKEEELGPGKLFIFNHLRFNNKNLSERSGTGADVDLLQRTFATYDVDVESVFTDYTVNQIKSEVDKIATEPFSNNSCIIVVFLTHGFRNNYIAAKDTSHNFNEILLKIQSNHFLEFKPKIFLVQACRGPVNLLDFQSDGLGSSENNSNTAYFVDNTYIFYSTSEAIAAYRYGEKSDIKGSIFIIEFCKAMQNFGSTKSITKIFEIVKEKVQAVSSRCQFPEVRSTALEAKSYYFGKYCKPSNPNYLPSTSKDFEEKEMLTHHEIDKPSSSFSTNTKESPPIKQIIDNVFDLNLDSIKEYQSSPENSAVGGRNTDGENQSPTCSSKTGCIHAGSSENPVLGGGDIAGEPITDKWVRVCNCGFSSMPENLVVGGKDLDRDPIYVGRANFFHDLLPAKVFLKRENCCYVSYAGYEYKLTDNYEVLTGDCYKWVPSTGFGSVPPNAVVGGKTVYGEVLYIGRAPHDLTVTPGKIHPSNKCLYIPFDGEEIRLFNYEVLVRPNDLE